MSAVLGMSSTPAGVRPGWLARHRSVLVGASSVLGVLLLFEALSRSGALPSRYLPPMSDVVHELLRQLGTTELWREIGQTLQAWAIGLAIATAVAVPAGLVIASSWALTRATRPVVEFLRPIPSVALIPLAVLVFGTGTSMAVFLVAFASFWPVVVQTMYGVRDVDPVLLDTGRVLGWGPARRLRRIVLPSTVPYIATGFRVASAFALILSVTAELVVGSGGLGQAITVAQEGGAVTLMYALIIATGLLALALNTVVRRVEARLLRWHPSHRGEGVGR